MRVAAAPWSLTGWWQRRGRTIAGKFWPLLPNTPPLGERLNWTHAREVLKKWCERHLPFLGRHLFSAGAYILGAMCLPIFSTDMVGEDVDADVGGPPDVRILLPRMVHRHLLLHANLNGRVFLTEAARPTLQGSDAPP